MPKNETANETHMIDSYMFVTGGRPAIRQRITIPLAWKIRPTIARTTPAIFRELRLAGASSSEAAPAVAVALPATPKPDEGGWATLVGARRKWAMSRSNSAMPYDQAA